MDVVFCYGSHLHGLALDPRSALDMVAVINESRPFYRGLASAGLVHCPAWLMTALAHVLPPNAIQLGTEDFGEPPTKVLIVSRGQFEKALGPNPPDHFLTGRLFQNSSIVWARSPDVHAWAEDVILATRARVLDWVGPFLDSHFDADSLGVRMLQVSYSGELRPEGPDRARQLYQAQRDTLRPWLVTTLEEGLRSGVLKKNGPTYQFAIPQNDRQRRPLLRYFARSKRRSTLRWFKWVVMFDGWLDYAVRKVERHSGESVQLSVLERRWPLIFLWPRVYRLFRSRPRPSRGA